MRFQSETDEKIVLSVWPYRRGLQVRLSHDGGYYEIILTEAQMNQLVDGLLLIGRIRFELSREDT